MPSPRPGESHEGVLEEPPRAQSESRSKEEGSAELEGRERLMPSPGPGESHEGALGSHNGLNPSWGAWRRLSRARGASRRLKWSTGSQGEPEKSIRESQATQYESGEEKEDSSKSCELKETQPSPKEPRTRTEAGGRKPRSWGVYVIRRRFMWSADVTPILQQLVGQLD